MKTKIKFLINSIILAIPMIISNASANTTNQTGVDNIFVKEQQSFPTSPFFHAEVVNKNIYRIFGVSGEIVYLIEGEKKAVLIDAGMGVGNLKSYIEQFTKKPVTLLLSHGHVDHINGSEGFKDVYINHLDDKVYTEHSQMGIRKEFLELTYPKFGELKTSDYAQPKALDEIKNLSEGDKFELGGVSITAYNAAGHTPGQMAFLIEPMRILFTGDSANMFTFMLFDHSLGIKSYKQSMETLHKKTQGSYDRILVSHGSGDMPVTLLPSIIKLTDDILVGNTDDIEFNFMGQKAYIAKAIDDKMQRVDGGVGNIVYVKDKINE